MKQGIVQILPGSMLCLSRDPTIDKNSIIPPKEPTKEESPLLSPSTLRKILVIGDTAVGKTSVIRRFMTRELVAFERADTTTWESSRRNISKAITMQEPIITSIEYHKKDFTYWEDLPLSCSRINEETCSKQAVCSRIQILDVNSCSDSTIKDIQQVVPWNDILRKISGIILVIDWILCASNFPSLEETISYWVYWIHRKYCETNAMKRCSIPIVLLVNKADLHILTCEKGSRVNDDTFRFVRLGGFIQSVCSRLGIIEYFFSSCLHLKSPSLPGSINPMYNHSIETIDEAFLAIIRFCNENTRDQASCKTKTPEW